MRRNPVVSERLADPSAERVRRSVDTALREVQDLPASSIRVIRRVRLPNDQSVLVAHRLGRRPLAFWTSPPDGAATPGVIQDWGSLTPLGTPNDLTKTLSLVAKGFGATITVDVIVM